MKSLSELLSLYSKAYVHYIDDRDYKDDVYELYEQTKMMSEFANMIATEPFSNFTQQKALFYEEQMSAYHSDVIKNISDKDYDERIYPCKCLKEYIKNRVKELENKIYENDEEKDEEKKDKLYKEYDRWLMCYRYY